MNELQYDCDCGRNDWSFEIDSDLTSWIRCQFCHSPMFGPDIGVILINWKATDLDEWTLKDVLLANQDDGVVKTER